MAKALPEKVSRKRPARGYVGRKLLEAITAGMYSNPLMSIREYIQNAADAVDSAVAKGLVAPGDERICVSTSGRRVRLLWKTTGVGSLNSELNVSSVAWDEAKSEAPFTAGSEALVGSGASPTVNGLPSLRARHLVKLLQKWSGTDHDFAKWWRT